jgi:probable HAF family extracellular repeat protein
MARFRTSHLGPLAALALAASLPAASAIPAAAATTTYTITDLGSLGQGTVGSAVNATGQVTGYSYLSTLVQDPAGCPPNYPNPKKCVEHPWHAFLYSNGQVTDLGTVGGGDFSEGNAVNLSGQVAGASATNNGGSAAFLWNGKKTINLGQQAPLNGSDSDAAGINDAGQVVGRYGTTGTPEHAFLYSNGTMTGLPEPSFTGPNGCEADAINNTGQIAGTCGDSIGQAHLVLWHNGAVTDLGTLGPTGTWSFTQAVAINNNEQIAGTVFSGGTTEGFLYSNGAITNLGGFLPAAINDKGVMVGGPSVDTGGTVQNLNTLIPAGSGYQIQNATAINDNGQIVASATGSSSGAVLLTPS